MTQHCISQSGACDERDDDARTTWDIVIYPLVPLDKDVNKVDGDISHVLLNLQFWCQLKRIMYSNFFDNVFFNNFKVANSLTCVKCISEDWELKNVVTKYLDCACVSGLLRGFHDFNDIYIETVLHISENKKKVSVRYFQIWEVKNISEVF